jgi:hypothetical protein
VLVNWLVSETFRSPLLTPSAHFLFNKYKAKAQSLKANRQVLDLARKLINADIERIKADLLPNMLATANANP